MTRSLQFLMLWAFVLAVAGCRHSDPEAEKALQLGISPEQNRKMIRDSPLYNYLMTNSVDYKAQTEAFLERVRSKHTPAELQLWAQEILNAHNNESEQFYLSTNEMPDFVLHLDPPLEPFVIVHPKSYLTIAWGGGFGFWGLLVGDSKAPDNSVIYSIEWVPGVYAFHDLQ